MNKNISDSLIKAIPTAWRERILKRDFFVTLGKMLQPQQKSPNETEEAYLRSANIQWSGVDVSDVKTMWFSPQEKQDLLLRSGDLLVNEGGDIGRCAIWNGELPECYIQNAINRIRPRTGQSPRFLYYWLNSLKAAGYLDAIVTRITIAHLTAEKLERVPWPDVPIAEQQRIADFLDSSCAAIDAAVTAKRMQIEVLDELQKSILQKALTKGLGDAPIQESTDSRSLPDISAHWRFIRIKQIAAIRYGLGQPPAESADGIPIIRATNVNAGKITETNLMRVAPEDLPLTRNPYLKEEEIIVVRSGAYTGDSAIIPAQYAGAVAGYDMVMTVTDASPRFVSYCLLSDYVLKGQIFLLTLRAAQPHLNAEELGSVLIALPPSLEEQNKIVDFLDKKLNELKTIVNNIQHQISTLTAYRKSLIHECVTGKRRVA